MNVRQKSVFNWSGGKDSALALYKVLQGDKYEVISLLTTISADSQKSSIHSIPIEILQRQAKSIGIPLYTVESSVELNNYNEQMSKAVNHFKTKGVKHFIFGDIFLHDVKAYRENHLTPLGIEIVEPLWDRTPKDIIDEFLKSGIKSKIVVTQADKLDKTFVGRDLDRELIESLPEGVDLCGENGEYHTLAYEGGLFKKKIDFKINETKKISYSFKLDTGKIETYEYWQAEIGI